MNGRHSLLVSGALVTVQIQAATSSSLVCHTRSMTNNSRFVAGAYCRLATMSIAVRCCSAGPAVAAMSKGTRGAVDLAAHPRQSGVDSGSPASARVNWQVASASPSPLWTRFCHGVMAFSSCWVSVPPLVSCRIVCAIR
jgi:hypothetical protein